MINSGFSADCNLQLQCKCGDHVTLGSWLAQAGIALDPHDLSVLDKPPNSVKKTLSGTTLVKPALAGELLISANTPDKDLRIDADASMQDEISKIFARRQYKLRRLVVNDEETVFGNFETRATRPKKASFFGTDSEAQRVATKAKISVSRTESTRTSTGKAENCGSEEGIIDTADLEADMTSSTESLQAPIGKTKSSGFEVQDIADIEDLETYMISSHTGVFELFFQSMAGEDDIAGSHDIGEIDNDIVRIEQSQPLFHSIMLDS